MNAYKSELKKTFVKLLSRVGISPDPAKVEAILNFTNTVPSNVSDLEIFWNFPNDIKVGLAKTPTLSSYDSWKTQYIRRELQRNNNNMDLNNKTRIQNQCSGNEVPEKNRKRNQKRQHKKRDIRTKPTDGTGQRRNRRKTVQIVRSNREPSI